MFAGPNGSGKSTLINMIRKQYNIGYFINADEIESEINKSKFIKCSDFLPMDINQETFENFIDRHKIHDSRVSKYNYQEIKVTNGYMVINKPIDSYIAAIIAEFFRFILMECDSSFSFETVMSHESKVEYLQTIKKKGFKTYLYYISTQDPSINQNRVKIRVEKGGHNVDWNKIEKRYFRSMELLSQAFMFSDRAFIIDSSTNDESTVFIEKEDNKIKILKDEIPEWIQTYLIDKIQNLI